MDLIKLLDVSNPKKIKDTINLLIENYEGFDDEIRTIAQNAGTTATNALATAQGALEVSTESAETLAQSIATQNATIQQNKAEQDATIEAAFEVQDAKLDAQDEEIAQNTTTSDQAKQIAEEALAMIEQADARSQAATETAEDALDLANESIETSELAMNIATDAKSTVDQAISTGVFGTFVHNTAGISLLHAYMTDNLNQENTDENFYMATPKLVRDALPQCIEIEMNMQTGQASITVEQFEKLLENPENYIVVNMSLTDSDGSTRTESVKFTRGSYRKAETSSYWVEHLLFNSVNTGDTEKTPYMYLILARHSISPNDIGIGMGGEEYATVNQLNNKVDKVTNMGLSTNDYTTEEKDKLSGIEAGAEVNTVTSVNGKTGAITLSADDVNALPNTTVIPTALSDLTSDITHRTVTDTEKAAWNAKSDFSGSYNDLTDKPTIPTTLAELTEDSTHRLVTDTEKSTWNAKSDFSGSYNDLTDKPTISTINVDGQPQSTLNFDSDPQTQIDNIVNNTTIIKNSVKGFNAGEFASAGQGGAVGWYSYTETGFSGGSNSNSNNGGAIGNSSVTDSGGAVGSGASSGVGFSGGYNAKVSHINGAFIDAIQLGTGTNTTEKSLQIYDDNIYNANTHTLTASTITAASNLNCDTDNVWFGGGQSENVVDNHAIKTTSSSQTVNNNSNNYVRYNSGLIIQWGHAPINTDNSVRITFSYPFIDANYSIVVLDGDNTDWNTYVNGYRLDGTKAGTDLPLGKSSTQCQIAKRGFVNDFDWIAIGRWK